MTAAKPSGTSGDQLALTWDAPAPTSKMAEHFALQSPKRRRKPAQPSAQAPKPSAAATPELATPARLTRAGRPRHHAQQPGFGAGRPHPAKGRRYPPDPVTADDVDAMLKHLTVPRNKMENRNGALSRLRLRAAICTLWRSGLRISELLDLEHRDLNRDDLCITVRSGKGDKRRISAMDEWGWVELNHWITARAALPAGPVFCVLSGVTAGQRWGGNDLRKQLHTAAKAAGVTRRVAPHQFRHAHTVDLWRDDIDLFVVMQQLGHARLDVTALYLRSLAPVEVLKPIGQRRPPLMPVRHSS